MNSLDICINVGTLSTSIRCRFSFGMLIVTTVGILGMLLVATRRIIVYRRLGHGC
jgi:hypothetical protein